MNMYDIHMHIIPNVDDGSWNMDMSIQMLYMAYEQGIRKIIATPHSSAFAETDNEVEEGFHQLQEIVAKLLPDMHLYLGCEVKCRRVEMDKILEDLSTRRIPTLNKTKYVLIEFSKLIESAEALECVQRIVDAGWYPVLAHVERYSNLFEDDRCIEKLQSMGCLFQINVYSVFDEDNEIIKQNALRLIENKRVTFLGSDAHRTIHRPPSVKYGLQYLYDYYEKEYVDQIAFDNAGKLLDMKENRIEEGDD